MVVAGAHTCMAWLVILFSSTLQQCTLGLPASLVADEIGQPQLHEDAPLVRSDEPAGHPLAWTQPVRSLQATSASVTVVKQPAELQLAVANGDAHIQIEEHLDLSTMDLVGVKLLGSVPATVKSIRGNCATAPNLPGLTSPALLPLRPRQCLLLADSEVFEMNVAGGHLWLHNVYLRAKHSTRDTYVRFFDVSNEAKLWMTAVTMQGADDVRSRALQLMSPLPIAVYAQDCTFASIYDYVGVIRVRSEQGTLALVDCSFVNNQGELIDTTYQSSVLLRRPLLRNNSADVLFNMDSDDGTQFFAEGADIPVWDETIKDLVEMSGTAPMTAEEEARFLSVTDDWFVETQEELGLTPLSVRPTSDRTRSPDSPLAGSESAAPTALIASVSTVAVVALIATLAAAAVI